MYSPNNQTSNENYGSDELDNWFNELDEKTIDIINNNLIKEEDSDNESYPNHQIKNPIEFSDDKILEETKCVCIDDILKKIPESLSSNELIQCECSIIYFIQVLIEGSVTNKVRSNKLSENENENDLSFDKMQSIIEYLEWISLSCKTLAKRINQDLIIYKTDTKPSIIRSSYNFCTKYTQCKNFYSKHETPNCTEHHYVHSLLKYDIDSVIMFLYYIIKNNITISKEEFNNLYLSIKTIYFVIRHMAKEISYINYITKNNSEIFHRNNPIETKKKFVHKIIQPEHMKYNKLFMDKYEKKKLGNFKKPINKITINKSSNIVNNRYSILSEF